MLIPPAMLGSRPQASSLQPRAIAGTAVIRSKIDESWMSLSSLSN
jgi:hypothetical protein